VESQHSQTNLNNFVPEIINMVVLPENITVTIENELPVIECEEEHIMQIFQNLLSNALKYMDKPQGWIKIGCVEQDGFWKFSVADNGPAIKKNTSEKSGSNRKLEKEAVSYLLCQSRLYVILVNKQGQLITDGPYWSILHQI